MHPHSITQHRECPDCGVPISNRGARCKSCAARKRHRDGELRPPAWTDDDPRHQQLRERNQSGRAGLTPYQDREWLRSRYEDRQMPMRKIAKEAACSVRTIARWLAVHGIATRSNADATRLVIRRGPSHPSWKNATMCPSCGGKKGSASKTCNPCYWTRNSGPNNHGWKGGHQYRGSRNDEWRSAVLERDGNRCQDCGETKNLHAHHIKSWRDYPALRLDPDNGLTLCRTCHTNRHRKEAS